MNLKFVKVRFNLDKEADRAALSILDNADMSYSKFTISAINAYGSYLSHEKEKKVFFRQVLETIDGAIRSNAAIGLAGLKILICQ